MNNKVVAGIVLLNIGVLAYLYYYDQLQNGSNVVLSSSTHHAHGKEGQADVWNGYSYDKSPIDVPTKEVDLHKITAAIRSESVKNKNSESPTRMKVGPAELRRPKLNISSLPPALYKMRKPVFDLLPKSYLPGYKSPCWKAKPRMVLRCLPYFYLLGMPKSGTTDLWTKILRHPEVKDTSKEPHWWTRSNGKGTLGSYTSRSKGLVKSLMLHPSLKSRLIIGDGSASTLWDNHKWKTWNGERYEGPTYVTADVMHAAQPDAKLLVILRNPVDRLYSGYLYFNPKYRIKTSADLFHKEVVAVINRFNKCLKTMSYRGCVYSIKDIHDPRVFCRLLIGVYSVYVRDWFRAYPRDQLKIMRLEDWHVNCTGMLPEVFDFLNLERLSDKQIRRFCTEKLQNGNQAKLHVVGDMLPKTRKLLENFYEGSNKELSLLLGDEKYLWRS
ncbi:carbohydrate sulfotransferase 15-like [Lytechinus pictus]|uniref:carbohydrate sulfotransferase 15-like n=1 Tax=Lytechinus pictus TaxID=7653 RepID=UPI0030B9D11D